MDTTSISYLVPTAILLLPFSFFFFFLVNGRFSNPKNHPPGSGGWPILGEAVNFGLSGPQNFVFKRMKKFSPDVFQTSLMGEKIVMLCGAQGNKFMFTNDTKLFKSWLPQSFKKAVFIQDYSEHTLNDITANILRCTHELLGPNSIKQYIPIMDSMAREQIEKDWSPHTQVQVFPLAKIYAFALAWKLLMHIDDPELVARLMKNYNMLTNGLFSVPINFPGTAYNCAFKGGKVLHEELMKIIGARKEMIMANNGRAGIDLLSKMLLSKNESGQFFDEKLISGILIAYIVATYDTASSAITFLFKHLSEHPDIYKQVRREQMEIAESKGPGDLLNWEDIQKMTYSWNVVRESIRIFPPGQGVFREAKTDFTFAGFTIPRGWKIFLTVYSTHKNPEYYQNPENFDPSRFEGSGPQPYTYIPFGGGPHMCPGKDYARVQILVFLHNVVKNFKLEKLISDEKILYQTSPIPANGFPVRLHRHE